jgi:hypothetical protein
MIWVVSAWTKPLAREALSGTKVFAAWELAIIWELTVAKLLVAELVVTESVVGLISTELFAGQYASAEGTSEN